MLAHVLLRVRLEHAGEPESEGAQTPADHRRIPKLAAVEAREPGKELRTDARSVVGREDTVAGPDPHGLRIGVRHGRHDAVERVVPSGAPKIVAAPIADQRMQQARGVVDDLARRPSSYAEEPLTVRIGFIP